MADLNLKLDLRLTKNLLRNGLAALLVLASASDIQSESVTLTTYYPAPSGVYSNMITTSNTFLARDGGNTTGVGVGTTAITAGSKLTINGGNMDITTVQTGVNGAGNGMFIGGTTATSLYAGGNISAANITARGSLVVTSTVVFNGGITGAYALTPNYANWAVYGTGDGGAAVYNDNGSYHKLMIVGNNSWGGGNRRIGLWDDVRVYNNLRVDGAAGIVAGAAPTSCTTVYWNAGSNVNLSCGGGSYLTTIAGVGGEYSVPPVYPVYFTYAAADTLSGTSLSGSSNPGMWNSLYVGGSGGVAPANQTINTIDWVMAARGGPSGQPVGWTGTYVYGTQASQNVGQGVYGTVSANQSFVPNDSNQGGGQAYCCPCPAEGCPAGW